MKPAARQLRVVRTNSVGEAVVVTAGPLDSEVLSSVVADIQRLYEEVGQLATDDFGSGARNELNRAIVTAKIVCSSLPLKGGRLVDAFGQVYSIEEIDGADLGKLDDRPTLNLVCIREGGFIVLIHPNESQHRGRPHCSVTANGKVASFDIPSGNRIVGDLGSRNHAAAELVRAHGEHLLQRWQASRPDDQRL